MSLITRLAPQSLLPHVANIKKELKTVTARYQFKLDLSTFMQFKQHLDDCKFKFQQIQDTAIAYEETSKLLQEQLTKVSRKLVQVTPDFINAVPLNRRVRLEQIAEQFHHHQRRPGLEAFVQLKLGEKFPHCAKSIFDYLKFLKGLPESVNSQNLFTEADHTNILDLERAEAINAFLRQQSDGVIPPSEELLKRTLHEIASNFVPANIERALLLFRQFAQVYPKVADCIYGKIWELYDRPTEHHLAEFNHSQFGELAFYGTHPNPNFQPDWDKNMRAIQLTLEQLKITPELMAEQNIKRLDNRCVAVANETIGVCKMGSYTDRSGHPHFLKDHINFAVANTRKYSDAGSYEPKKPRFVNTQFEVRAQNCVDMSYDLCIKGYHPLVLNLANSHHPGGCYLRARGTQEEELFRTTAAAAALDSIHGFQKQDLYPIHTKIGRGGGIYTPQVPLFRMGMNHDYEFFDEPVFIGLATIGAYNKPALNYADANNPRLEGECLHWTREKIRTIYQMAYDNGHDCIILGALGCGAFANPPQHIIELFLDVHEKEFKQCFKYVGFAVMEDMNRGKQHNPEGNFLPFARAVQRIGGHAYGSKGAPLPQLDG